MKIYISSTFTDLREYRAAAADVLAKLGHDVRGMETYVAESSRPVDVCEGDARNCDVFVLLLAWRYGYVPEPQSRMPPLSITELEYEAAAGSPKTNILPFLVRAEAPWPAQQMDAITKERDSSSIEAFRHRVSRDHMVSTFSTPDELAREVAAAVRRVEATERLTERALRSADRGQVAQMRAEGLLTDTAAMTIVEAITNAADAEVVTVELGDGKNWWSTRLYLLASLAADLTSIRQFLFTGRDVKVLGHSTLEVLGLSTPAVVRDRLKATFSVLGDYELQLGATDQLGDTTDEANRRLSEWHVFFSRPGGEEASRVWVRHDLLEHWLGEYLIRGVITLDHETGLTVSQVQQILDWPWPYVPVRGLASPDPGVDETSPIVVNRDAFALELAREWVARELPRNPAR